ncbi:hypothetical protein N7510_003563 [Penicillium lagena]|uniref:uncharacterized protein n=1 Tax=Penicillium lagena TaxID=94218 RepID=UPI002540997C|nr:uncharacterized protein N7510_003563 [Penicillium lagena]KAJ5619579.1 hypothetical protein N7510_003563 [Penicillium lagena]
MDYQTGARGCFNCKFPPSLPRFRLKALQAPTTCWEWPFGFSDKREATPWLSNLPPSRSRLHPPKCSLPAKEKSCYRCGETGHISRDCTQAGGDSYGSGGQGGQGGGQECYKCGQVGHIARNCSQNYGGYGGGSGGGFGGGRAQTCYSCGGFGHMARDCTHGQKCYNCGEVGHLSRDCPTEARGERVCYKCKQPGHVQAACPN